MPYLNYLFCEECRGANNLDLDFFATLEAYKEEGRKSVFINEKTIIWDYLIYVCYNCKTKYRYTYKDGLLVNLMAVIGVQKKEGLWRKALDKSAQFPVEVSVEVDQQRLIPGMEPVVGGIQLAEAQEEAVVGPLLQQTGRYLEAARD